MVFPGVYIGGEVDLKFTKLSHLEHLYSILIYGSVFLIGPVLFRSRIPDGYENHFVLWALVGFGLYFVPHAFLHLRYWYIDKSTRLQILKDEITIKRKGELDVVIPFASIVSVIHCETLNVKFRFIQFFPWDSYWYWVIETNKGERIAITNLLLNHYRLEVDRIPVEERVSFFPWPRV